MMPFGVKLLRFSRSALQSFLGIISELALVVFFFLTGLAVSLIWWGIFR